MMQRSAILARLDVASGHLERAEECLKNATTSPVELLPAADTERPSPPSSNGCGGSPAASSDARPGMEPRRMRFVVWLAHLLMYG